MEFNKSGYLKRPRSGAPSISLSDLKSRLSGDGSSLADPTPLSLPVRLPSIAQRVALYERAGAMRSLIYDEILETDDMGNIIGDPYGDDGIYDRDDLSDDLPEHGYSPYELRESDIKRSADDKRAARDRAVKRLKKAEEKLKAKSATPLRGGAPEPLPTSGEAPPQSPQATS